MGKLENDMKSMSEHQQAIGGYLELELGPGGQDLYPEAIKFQSARAAFLALLLHGKPKRIWLPWYICQTMADQAMEASIEVRRYGIDEHFAVDTGVELDAGDWLLYVNYFGLCEAQVGAVLARFRADRVIVDNSHALFAEPRECLATIYSPRKFVGVPDGGYLITSLDVSEPAIEDVGSVARCMPLLVRLAECAENGYPEYLETQNNLAGQVPMRMSRLTRRLLESIDYRAVVAKRVANFDVLDDSLSAKNAFPLRRAKHAVPLSYPFLDGSGKLRRALLSNRVYVPQYWPDLVNAGHVPDFERFLAQDCVPLPCDQRYSRADMAHVLNLVHGQRE
jgi:hypothetical protein